jgi:PKD repeat protein
MYSTGPTLPSGFGGANDFDATDPDLVGTSPPTKGPVTIQSAGYYGNFALKAGYDNAQNFRIESGSPAIDAAPTVTAPAGWNSDSYDTSMADYLDWSYDFANSGTNPLRTGSYDVGAHEFGVAETNPPTVVAKVEAADTYAAEVDEELNFTAVGSGGTGARTYAWTFGDGNTAAVKNPNHTYASAGHYVVTVTVTDAAGLTGTDTVTVTVKPKIGGGDAVIEPVSFNAGDATYAVTKTPKLIFWFSSLSTADDTLVDNAAIRMGIWSDDGEQFAASYYAVNDRGTTKVRSSNVDGAIMHHLEDDDSEIASKLTTISSVSSTAVTPSWASNQALEEIIAVNFGGDGIENATATTVTLGNEGSEYKIDGDFTYAIVPTSLRAGFNVNYNRAAIGLGMAVRDGGQVCHTIRNRTSLSTTDIRSHTSTSHIAYLPVADDYVTISEWDASGITFKAESGDINSSFPVGLLKNTDGEIQIGTFSTPTATGNNDYTTPAIDSQAGIFWGAPTSSLDSDITADPAGVFSIHSVDSAGADYTVAMTGADNVGTTNESSYFAGGGTDDWVQLDKDGAIDAAGALSLITNGFRINPTTAATSAYDQLWCLFQEGTVSSQLAASFAWYLAASDPADGEAIPAGQSVQFVENSATNFTVDTWTWAWGDGTANTTGTATPTHTFTESGTYSVTLTVEDTNSDTDSVTFSVVVITSSVTNGFNLNTDITPASGTGTAPLTCTVDLSGITAGSGETIDFIQLTVLATPDQTDDEDGEEGPSGSQGDGGGFSFDWETFRVDAGGSVEFTLDGAGAFDLYLEVYYENVDEPVLEKRYNEVFYVTDTDPNTVSITSDVGRYRVPRGPITIIPTVRANEVDQVDNSNFESILWTWTGNPAGGSTSTDWQPSVLLPAVSVATSYTIAVVVTGYDDETYSDSITDYITIYPTVTAPARLSTLMTRIANLRAVDYMETTDWLPEGVPNTSVYAATMTHPWADPWVKVTEDGDVLTAATSIANCQATAGSYFITFSTPTLTVYVHPTGSTSPITNGSTYRWLYSGIYMTESVSVGETVTMIGPRNITEIDAITVGESVTLIGPRNIGVSETVTAGEAVILTGPRNADETEAVSVNEHVTVQVV